MVFLCFFFFSSRRRHTRCSRDWSSDVCSSDLEDYYQQYSAHISAITKDDVLRVAKQYIDLDHLAIVIVGDRATIEGPLRTTGIAPIVVTDIEGNPKTSQ